MEYTMASISEMKSEISFQIQFKTKINKNFLTSPLPMYLQEYLRNGNQTCMVLTASELVN